jgi:hypothetical protein
MQNKIIKQSLICTLTGKERREYGIQLATTLGDIDEIEAEKKRTMDHFKDRIAGLQAQADEVSRKVRDGKEWRQVECCVMLGAPDKRHKQIVRMDTGETVKTEVMDEYDLQTYLPFAQPDDTSEDESDPSDPSATQDGPATFIVEEQDDEEDEVEEEPKTDSKGQTGWAEMKSSQIVNEVAKFIIDIKVHIVARIDAINRLAAYLGTDGLIELKKHKLHRQYSNVMAETIDELINTENEGGES